jgi:alpha-2-macroglobulin
MTRSALWSAVDKLVEEQKYEQAFAELVALRAEIGDDRQREPELTEVLVKQAKLRSALGGHAAAVALLRDAPPPTGAQPRMVRELFLAELMLDYLRGYSWEIRQRTRVAGADGRDLTKLTADEIRAQAMGALERVWRMRGELDREPVASLGELLRPGSYPAGLRDRLRDLLTYQAAAQLADTSHWRPVHSNELYLLALDLLLGEQPAGAAPFTLDDASLHPLVRCCAALADLEHWHRTEGRREAALEASLERVRRISGSCGAELDAERLEAHLRAVLAEHADLPWWSAGQAQLAKLLRGRGALVSARALAAEGERRFPGTVGAGQCRELIAAIELPELHLDAMQSDGLGRPSILVRHRNLPCVHFRAIPIDVERDVIAGKDYHLLPSFDQWKRAASKQLRPVLGGKLTEWQVELPNPGDYQLHKTFVVPPLPGPGLYVVLASARPDFADADGNVVLGVNVIASDYVLLAQDDREANVDVLCVRGDVGAPVAGAEVSLLSLDWHKGHRVVARAKTDASGQASFPRQSSNSRCLVLGRCDGQWVVDPSQLYLYRQPEPDSRTQALIYTDRSIYRPEQRVQFKLVAYRGRPGLEEPKLCPSTRIQIELVEPNGKAVEQLRLRTNEHGSASGSFLIPAGRLLGRWQLRTSVGSTTAIRVEEYKRPTFELGWRDPSEPLRLGAPARLSGTARYYFGLPVTSGEARWRVERLPELPRSWWWATSESKSQRIAAGKAALAPDGSFVVEFCPEADPRQASHAGLTYRFRLEVEVTDEGGETRTATRTLRVGFSSLEATVQSERAFALAEQPLALTVRRVTLQGAPQPGVGSWRLLQVQQPPLASAPGDVPDPEPPEGAAGRESVPLAHDRYAGRWEQRRYQPRAWMAQWSDGSEIARGELRHGEDGVAALSLPGLPAGVYRLRYCTADERGQLCEAQHELLVVACSTPIGLPAILEVERSTVRVGETLRLFVASGTYDQVLAVERYEAGRRVERRWQRAGEPELHELRVERKHRGGFCYVLCAVRDFQLMRFEVAVTVPWDDRAVRIELETFRDTLRPGGHELWRVVLRGADGGLLAKRTAELLAYMFDRSLETFARHEPPDLLALYPTRAQALGCRSSLGGTMGQMLFRDGFRAPSGAADPVADRLVFYESWGIGGPGATMRMRTGAMPVPGCAPGGRPMQLGAPPPPPPACAPSPQAAGRAAPGQSAPAELAESSFGLAKADADADADAGGAPPQAEAEVRSDFAETAFFLPHLLTDADGAVSIEFDVPEAVTSWSVWLHAVTRDACGSSLRREAKTVKELLVRPYLPRFVREGDELELRVVVSNVGAGPLTGDVALDLLDAATSRDLAEAFGIGSRELSFAVAASQSTTVSYPLRVPRRLGPVTVRVVARADGLSDGEQRLLPVLPSRMHLSQSRFVTLRDACERFLRFEELGRDDDPSREHEQLVVTVDAQLFFSVVRALPFLVEYPYECSEQLLNRFVSSSILSKVFERHPALQAMARNLPPRTTPLEPWKADDPNRRMAAEETPWLRESEGDPSPWPVIDLLDPSAVARHREVALERLSKAQTASGGFPWFPSGPPSPFVTLYLLEGFARAAEFMVALPAHMIERAWHYLTAHFRADILPRVRKQEMPPESLVYLYYVLSAYRTLSLDAGAFSPEERAEIEGYCFANWKRVSPMLKAELALGLHRAGRPSDARLVLESVMDSARSEPERGTFWQAEERSWLWYRDTIESHAQILVTLQQVLPDHPARDGLVLWLLLNKKLNQWKSTRATAAVIYALTRYLEREGTLAVREQLSVTLGAVRHDFCFEPDRYSGRQQLVVPGPAIVPAEHSTIGVSKQTPGLAFASATWHFSTERLPERAEGDLLAVERRYLRCDQRGAELMLVPIGADDEVRVGDEVEVQLSLRAGHEAEYVHVRDPRPAGFEPEDRVSSYVWALGLGYYREIRDNGTSFFFDRLPPGEVPLRYRIRAATAGRFRCQPATVQPMYAPEFAGYSSGAVLVIGSGA